ncbi:Threonine/homoserine/homoserine lactone efflux protein [Devosia sp. YR412]|uniref:LysE family translocator n=1 Tax=Devosia sp. YR412 TaxID=1881030 RepID=UPI0008D85605|nr:LysE family translocator [Devosia sp. YR412]SEQ61736.1 Threonine/homoserine/homoserine lactone efflux protein [Devosia sp. YR412]
MDYAQSLWLFSVLLFGIIVVPGMDMFFVIANALTGGRKAGLAAVAGIMLGGAVHTLFGALAVGVLAQLPVAIFQTMILIGAAYMAWIGFTLLRSAITVDAIGTASTRSNWVAFRQGTVTCLLNPKAYLFVLAVYPQFLRPEFGPIWSQAIVMGLLSVSMQFLVYGALALAAGRGRDALVGNPSATIWIGRGAGALFLVAALVTAWHGVTQHAAP